MSCNKPGKRDLSRYLNSLDADDLRRELLTLYERIPQVQAYYQSELGDTQAQEALFETYKLRLQTHFLPQPLPPLHRPSHREAAKIIREFNKVCVFPHLMLELQICYLEQALKASRSLGLMPSHYYDALSKAFAQTLEKLKSAALLAAFKPRIVQIIEEAEKDYFVLGRDLAQIAKDYFE